MNIPQIRIMFCFKLTNFASPNFHHDFLIIFFSFIFCQFNFAVEIKSSELSENEIPLPELVSIQGECHVKIDGKLAKLFKFGGEKTARYLFYSDNKLQILHENAGKEFLKRKESKKEKCHKVEDVLQLFSKGENLFYRSEYIRKQIVEIYVKLEGNGRECKAFDVNEEIVEMGKGFGKKLREHWKWEGHPPLDIFKCPLVNIWAGKEQNNFDCQSPQLFIPIGTKIYQIIADKDEQKLAKTPTFLGEFPVRPICNYFGEEENFKTVTSFESKSNWERIKSTFQCLNWHWMRNWVCDLQRSEKLIDDGENGGLRV